MDCYDEMFVPGLIDLLTQPLAAQVEEIKYNATQGRGVDPFNILTCETHVNKRTQSFIRGSQVVPPDEVKKTKSLFKILSEMSIVPSAYFYAKFCK